MRYALVKLLTFPHGICVGSEYRRIDKKDKKEAFFLSFKQITGKHFSTGTQPDTRTGLYRTFDLGTGPVLEKEIRNLAMWKKNSCGLWRKLVLKLIKLSLELPQ